jgi:hypothetical protein
VIFVHIPQPPIQLSTNNPSSLDALRWCGCLGVIWPMEVMLGWIVGCGMWTKISTMPIAAQLLTPNPSSGCQNAKDFLLYSNISCSIRWWNQGCLGVWPMEVMLVELVATWCEQKSVHSAQLLTPNPPTGCPNTPSHCGAQMNWDGWEAMIWMSWWLETWILAKKWCFRSWIFNIQQQPNQDG